MGMSFRNIRWSIACTLLVVASASAQTSTVTPLRSECPARTIESRLESIEVRLLEGIEKIVSTCNNPLIKKPCTVDLASYGNDDSPRYGYVRTSEGSSDEIYVPEQVDRYRGVTLFELDATTCRTRNRQRFDTYWLAYDRVQLLETLESAITRSIIVGVTADSAEYVGEFQNSAGSYLTRYNMNLTGLQNREKFAFIIQKGYPKKTVFQKKSRYGESLQMRIVLSGNTVSDVTFTRV